MSTQKFIKKVAMCALELTNLCNMNCGFCAYHLMKRPKGSMELSLAKRLIKEVKDTGFCDTITTNVMGEPLLYKEIFEVLRYATELRQKITFLTNGEKLTDEVSSRLLEYPPVDIGISYHSHDEHSFRQRGATISYEEYKRRVQGLIELKFKQKANVSISVNVITTQNMPHERFSILETIDAVNAFANEWIAFAKMLKRKYGLRWDIPRRIYPGGNLLLPGFFVVLYPVYHLWSNAIAPAGVKIVSVQKEVCFCAFKQFNVLWNGDVTICCIDYDGDLVYDSIQGKRIVDVFNSERIIALRKNFLRSEGLPPKCQACLGTALGKGVAGCVMNKYPLSRLDRFRRLCRLGQRLLCSPKEIVPHMRAVLETKGIGKAMDKMYWDNFYHGA